MGLTRALYVMNRRNCSPEWRIEVRMYKILKNNPKTFVQIVVIMKMNGLHFNEILSSTASKFWSSTINPLFFAAFLLYVDVFQAFGRMNPIGSLLQLVLSVLQLHEC